MKQTKLWILATLIGIDGACISAGCSSCNTIPAAEQQSTLQRITERGTLIVGTTGDYRPLSYRETDGTYWGFDIEMAQKIATRIGVGIEFVCTSWPTLTTDVLAQPDKTICSGLSMPLSQT